MLLAGVLRRQVLNAGRRRSISGSNVGVECPDVASFSLNDRTLTSASINLADVFDRIGCRRFSNQRPGRRRPQWGDRRARRLADRGSYAEGAGRAADLVQLRMQASHRAARPPARLAPTGDHQGGWFFSCVQHIRRKSVDQNRRKRHSGKGNGDISPAQPRQRLSAGGLCRARPRVISRCWHVVTPQAPGSWG
jgi:hypothetical protein